MGERKVMLDILLTILSNVPQWSPTVHQLWTRHTSACCSVISRHCRGTCWCSSPSPRQCVSRRTSETPTRCAGHRCLPGLLEEESLRGCAFASLVARKEPGPARKMHIYSELHRSVDLGYFSYFPVGSPSQHLSLGKQSLVDNTTRDRQLKTTLQS